MAASCWGSHNGANEPCFTGLNRSCPRGTPIGCAPGQGHSRAASNATRCSRSCSWLAPTGGASKAVVTCWATSSEMGATPWIILSGCAQPYCAQWQKWIWIKPGPPNSSMRLSLVQMAVSYGLESLPSRFSTLD